MITYEYISQCALRAICLLGLFLVEENAIKADVNTKCIIVGETFLYKLRPYCVLIEEEGYIDIPHDFDELDRKLKLFN